MIRISASLLSNYLAMIEDRISYDQFSKNIIDPDPPSLKMRAGTLFHHLIQNGEGIDVRKENQDQIGQDIDLLKFNEQDIIEARSKIDRRVEIFEYKIRKPYEYKNRMIYLTGVADQLLGNVVHEYKTTYGSFSYDNYADSIQWKLYCELFGVEEVRYQVWQISEPNEDGKEMKVKSYHEFSMFESECSRKMLFETIHSAVDLIYSKGLDQYLQLK
jgi:hypothetical protein